MFDSPRPVHSVTTYIQRVALYGTLAVAAVQAVPDAAAAVRHAALHPAASASRAHAPVHARAVPPTHGHPAPHGKERGASSARASRANASPRAQTGHHPYASVAAAEKSYTRPRGVPATPAVAARAQRPIAAPERAAQQAKEDRVHAWLQAQHPDAAMQHESSRESADTAKPVVLKSAAGAVPVAAQDAHPAVPAPVIRLSPAALQSDEAMHASAREQPSPTAPDDNAAIAEESHIPSTAPTERNATPFTHGDFNIAAGGGSPSGKSPAAPVLRASSPAASALLASKPRVDPVPVEVAALGNVGPAPVVHAPAAPVRLLPADEDAANAASLVKVNLYDSAGKLILIPPMKGTHDILVHQNTMAVADGLQRISNDGQLAGMRRSGLLTALPETAGIGVDERLPLNRRYARPWSVHFLNDLARAHYARFHTPLIVTSAVRTVAFQRHLVLVNGNAAPPTGDIASPHLYGQAVDIAKHGMSITEIAWMRAYLTPVETEGKIDVEEEFQQACFHISVYRSYLGLPGKQPLPEAEPPAVHTLQQAKAAPAKRRHISTALLAMRLR